MTMALTERRFVGPPSREDDPWRRVVLLGKRASRVGLTIGIVVALGTHGAASARALSALVDMRGAVRGMEQQLHEFFWATYDVDLHKEAQSQAKEQEPDPEPEPPPPPPPPVAKEEPAIDKPKEDPYEDEPPAAPAEASEVLTAKDDPAAPVDLTGDEFVTGKGTGPGYGYVSAAGTSKTPSFDPRSRVGGVEGGRGSGNAGPKQPKVNRSRPPGLPEGSRHWACPFPPEADDQQIHRATATIVVTVSGRGTPVSVRVLSDPGYGFGQAAKQCALGKRYEPALDSEGKPIQATTPPILVRFKR